MYFRKGVARLIDNCLFSAKTTAKVISGPKGVAKKNIKKKKIYNNNNTEAERRQSSILFGLLI